MKVAILPSSDLSYNSGSVIFAKNLFVYLREQGLETYLLCSKLPLDMKTDYLEFIYMEPDVLNHPIVDDRFVDDREYGNSISKCLNFLFELHSKFTLDLVHAHYASFNSLAASIFKGITGVPFIVSSFGRDINIGYEADQRIRWMIQNSLPYADKIIVPDKNIELKILEIFSLNNIKLDIEEIPMPFDNKLLEEGFLEIDKSLPIFATVNSCFSPEKGIDTIIKAFAELVKDFPSRLYIAGIDDHPEEIHKKKLVDLVNSLEISGNVVFLGYLDRRDVGELLRCSDLLIDARLNGNFSSILLESMFLSSIVLSSKNGASEKIIQDGENGVLFSSGDYKELSIKMKELVINEELRASIESNVRKWQNQNADKYTYMSCFLKFKESYIDIIKKKGK
ncbi:glycosyltransferase family 4 protein [Leptospira interrogans]|uniref:glycosyltransferase family 4 protein n=1 Tax=Leptospira interrogans TaxID=173 RepID=UPI001CE442EF|nr:glycosyltransferase family 4 protein [Leptospira interrogans]